MTNWQHQAVEFAQKHNFSPDPGVYALDCLSEMGEVAKEILQATAYGRRPPQWTPEIRAEMGDLLYSLCLLAESVDVDLDQALAETLAKYTQRWQEKGDIGSSAL